MVNAALIIGCARAILVVATDGKILDTILYGMAGAISGFHPVVSAQIMFVSQCVINFFVHSGTAQAALTMPIMAPLGDLVGITRQTAVFAFQLAEYINPILPTSGVTMGVLGLAGLRWEKWAKWLVPLLVALGALRRPGPHPAGADEVGPGLTVREADPSRVQCVAMRRDDKKNAPRIKVTKDGPYIVSGNVPLTEERIVLGPDGEPAKWDKGPSLPASGDLCPMPVRRVEAHAVLRREPRQGRVRRNGNGRPRPIISNMWKKRPARGRPDLVLRVLHGRALLPRWA